MEKGKTITIDARWQAAPIMTCISQKIGSIISTGFSYTCALNQHWQLNMSNISLSFVPASKQNQYRSKQISHVGNECCSSKSIVMSSYRETALQ